MFINTRHHPISGWDLIRPVSPDLCLKLLGALRNVVQTLECRLYAAAQHFLLSRAPCLNSHVGDFIQCVQKHFDRRQGDLLRSTEKGKLLQRPNNLRNRSFQHPKYRVYVGLGELVVVPSAIHSTEPGGERLQLSKSKHNHVDSSSLLCQSRFPIAQLLCDTQFVSFASKAIGSVTNRQRTSRCNPCASRSQPISHIPCFEAFERNVTACHCDGSSYNAHSERHSRDYTSIAPRYQRRKIHKRATPCGIHAVGGILA